MYCKIVFCVSNNHCKYKIQAACHDLCSKFTSFHSNRSRSNTHQIVGNGNRKTPNII